MPTCFQIVSAGDVIEVSGSLISRTITGDGRIFIISTNPQQPLGNLPLLDGKLDAAREKLGRAVALLGQVKYTAYKHTRFPITVKFSTLLLFLGPSAHSRHCGRECQACA